MTSEPSLRNTPPIFVEHGGRIEVTWPLGRGLFWTTPDAVEGWAAQVNELRTERDQLIEAFTALLAEFGQDVHDERVLETWSAIVTTAEMADYHQLIARKATDPSTNRGDR